MPPARHSAFTVILSLSLVIACHFVVTGCDTAPTAEAQATSAVADVTVTYKGKRLSDAQIAAHLGQPARVDTLSDDGHSAAIKLLIEDGGAGNYRTSIDVLYDDKAISESAFLSAPGQSAAAESADTHVTVTVNPGP